jgi:hypothetical protein
MYVLNIIYLQPLNHKSTASGASGASLSSGASRESLESGAAGPSEGENGRFEIDVAGNVHSLLHFRMCAGSAAAISWGGEGGTRVVRKGKRMGWGRIFLKKGVVNVFV